MDHTLEEKRDLVARQFKEAMYHEGQVVQQVTCECGLTMPLRFAYRCYYCGQFYCDRCMGIHLGMTRQEYYSRTKILKEVGHEANSVSGANEDFKQARGHDGGRVRLDARVERG